MKRLLRLQKCTLISKHMRLINEPHTFREIPQFTLFATHMTSQKYNYKDHNHCSNDININ